RRTNISHSCQNFVPASSRFNNNNSASNTSKTNRTKKPFTDRSNLEIQKERHVQNEENMTQHNDYDFFESEIQDIEEESIIQIEDNTIIQDVVGEKNRVRDNNSNEDIGCIIETRNSHVSQRIELVKILKHPEFKCNKVPNNLASLKRYRNGLPLLPVKKFIQYRIESNTKIGRILAFVTDKNNNTKIKVQQFLYNYELPRNFHSAARDSTKLRMTDWVIMISESRIITRISVWLKDNQESSSYDYKHYQNTQFSSMLHNHKLKFLCDTWYILSASMNDDISEVSGKWSLQEIRKAGFNGKDLDDNMKILFEILDDDSSLRSTVKLHVGDIVDVPEVSGDNDDDNEE
ncbi:12532_t:CDS:2, partial [Rhizophagus irregularis]